MQIQIHVLSVLEQIERLCQAILTLKLQIESGCLSLAAYKHPVFCSEFHVRNQQNWSIGQFSPCKYGSGCLFTKICFKTNRTTLPLDPYLVDTELVIQKLLQQTNTLRSVSNICVDCLHYSGRYLVLHQLNTGIQGHVNGTIKIIFCLIQKFKRLHFKFKISYSILADRYILLNKESESYLLLLQEKKICQILNRQANFLETIALRVEVWLRPPAGARTRKKRKLPRLILKKNNGRGGGYLSSKSKTRDCPEYIHTPLYIRSVNLFLKPK